MDSFPDVTESNTVLDRPIKGEESPLDDIPGYARSKGTEFDPQRIYEKLLEDIAKTDDSISETQESQNKESLYQAKVITDPITAEIELFDEPFLLMKRGNDIHLKHAVWSLSGFGKTYDEAFNNLWENGKELLTILDDSQKEELSPELLDMIYFLKVYFGDE